jgi:hypothetical protein
MANAKGNACAPQTFFPLTYQHAPSFRHSHLQEVDGLARTQHFLSQAFADEGRGQLGGLQPVSIAPKIAALAPSLCLSST